MNAVALKSHSFVARLGAILAAFVLAFSLVSLTAQRTLTRLKL